MSLKDKMEQGLNVYGTCITSTAPRWPGLVAATALDFVFLDTEHIVLDNRELSMACHAYLVHGIAPIVRIPSPDPYRACQVLDAGALGIVIPYVEKRREVRELIGAVKYRPLKGDRLYRMLFENEKLEPGLHEFLKLRNRDLLCIINIESVPAIENLDNLLNVEGLDAVFIGPHDLSISLGLPEQYDHEDFKHAVKTIIDRCRHFGLGVGIHFSLEAERQRYWVEQGVNMVVHSSDMALFSQRLAQDLMIIRGDEKHGDGAGDPSAPAI